MQEPESHPRASILLFTLMLEPTGAVGMMQPISCPVSVEGMALVTVKAKLESFR